MKILKVALQNYSAYNKHYFKLICAFIALVFLLTLFPTFSIAAADKYTEIKNKTVSLNYSLSYEEVAEDKISCDFSTEIIRQIDIASQSEEIFGRHLDYISTYRLALIIDGNTYKYRNDKTVTLYSSKEWHIFTENDYAESGVSNSEQFLIGRFPSSENEIVLSQEFLDCFNVSEDVIGKTIQIVSSEYQDRAILKDMVICGILTEEYCNLSGHINNHINFSPSILVSSDNSQTDRYEQKDMYITSFSNWLTGSDMEFLSSMNAQYKGKGSISKIEYVNKLQMVHRQIVLYVGISLIFGIILTVFLLFEKLYTATAKNSAMLLSVGTDNRQLTLIYSVQIAIAALIAAVISCPLSFAVFEIINAVLSNSLNIKLPVSLSLIFKMICISLGCIAGLTLIATFYLHLRFKNKQLRELM